MTLSVLIVPLRDFTTAKTRLSGRLSAEVRSELAALCAERVLERSVPCHRVVVCDSPDVESWSTRLGVPVVQVSVSGLNPALEQALPEIRSIHPGSSLVIAHGDIVDPAGLDQILSPSSPFDETNVVIVPDRRHDGTNVLRLDSKTAELWRFEYGPASFERHREQALALGSTVIVHEDLGLSTDLDVPEDLDQPLVRDFLNSHVPGWQHLGDTPCEREPS